MAEQNPSQPDPAESAARDEHAPAEGPAPTNQEAGAPVADGEPTAESTAEQALDSAQRAAETIKADTLGATGEASHEGGRLALEEFTPRDSDRIAAGLGLLDDIDLNVKVELGRTLMYVEDVLRLNENSVIELDKAAGDPVDIYVNDRHVARGEVLVLNENFCVRISEIIHDGAAAELGSNGAAAKGHDSPVNGSPAAGQPASA